VERRRRTAAIVGMLTILATVQINQAANVAASGATHARPRPHYRQIGPPTHVDLHEFRAAKTVIHPRLTIPFLSAPTPSATRGHAAPHGKTGRRQVVVVIGPPPTNSAVRGPLIEQKLAGFPVMDLSRQVGLYGSDQVAEPPDTQLAAGPVNIAEADNSTLSIWSKTGSLVTTADLTAFFRVPAGYFFTDPRILYDGQSTRWFLTGLSFNASSNSNLYIAVSTTSDPSGSWLTYTLGSGTGVIPDQPKPGVSSDKVVVSWNDYSGSSPSTVVFSGQETWVLQKSDLVSGASVHIASFGPDSTRFGIVPSQSLTSTTTDWLTYNNADCPSTATCNRGSPTVGVVAIDGTPISNNVTWTETDPAIAGTTSPPAPRQPSGVPVLQAQSIDDRLLAAVWQNGTLWVAGNDGCIPAGDSLIRSCMRMISVSTSGTPSVTQDFDAASNGFDLYYPAVTLDGSGDLFIAYSESSPSLYPSAVGIDSLAASPMTFENSISIASGQTSYSGTRWGDYSGAAQDPLNPADVWLTAEYQASAINPGDWGTATARSAIQPAITTIIPNSGPENVQQPVIIFGAHFQPGATVMFGSKPATSVVVVSGTQITATTPIGSVEGPVNVTVNQPDGTSVTLVSGYTYTREASSQSQPRGVVGRDPANQSPPAPVGLRIVHL